MNVDSLEPRPHSFVYEGTRRIAWHEFGQTNSPVATALYCHGTPGSGYEALFLDGAAKELGIRIIAPDRPGLGQSDPVAHRRVSTWAEEDAAALLEHLGLGQISVIGFSGGGPYAMSLAALYPHKVDQLILLAPFTHHSLWSTRIGLSLTPLRVHLACLISSVIPKGLLDRATAAVCAPLSPVSPLAAALGQKVQGRTAAYRMAVSHDYALPSSIDIEGGVQDEHAIQGDWGFSESTVKTPVHVWIGGSDRVVKPARARNLGLRLGAQIHELPRDGHFSLLMSCAGSFLAPVLSRAVNW
ncbi:alpha/beta fold hydrolase [Rothia sp. 88186D007BW]